MHVGIARGHRGNPAAAFHVHQLYGTPVLMSGLAPLVLSGSEVEIIEHHFKETLQRLQRLFPKTPRCVTYFLAGSLPGSALLHLRQLSLFGMIIRLNGSILNNYALTYFNSGALKTHSWFHQIRNLCLLYNLPHPIQLLSAPLSKYRFKKLIKSHVINYWEIKLRNEAAPLTSLQYFNPAYMSLVSPHPIWSTVGSSPAKVAMATIQAQMLSGRYRTEHLCSLWSPNSSEFISEDLDHIIRNCESLTQTRQKMQLFSLKYCKGMEHIESIVMKYSDPSHPQFCQYLLDCSILEDVIVAKQNFGDQVLYDLFHITRTYCYNIHKERMKLRGRWNPF